MYPAPPPEQALADEIRYLIGQWDAKVNWSGEMMADLLFAAGKAADILASEGVAYIVRQEPGDLRKFISSPALTMDIMQPQSTCEQVAFRKLDDVAYEPPYYDEEDDG